MSEQETTPKIFGAITAVMKSVEAVAKDRTSKGEKFSFAYRGIDDVINALHEAFAAHGVFFIPKVIERTHTPVIGFDGKPRGLHHLLCVEFTFYAGDGSSVTSTVWGECIENGDKGTGKAMSYALKTALLQIFMIPTEDDSKDPDSTNQEMFQQGRPQQQQRPQQQRPQQPQAPLPTHAPAQESTPAGESGTKLVEYRERAKRLLDSAATFDFAGKTGKSAKYWIDFAEKSQSIPHLEKLISHFKKLLDSSN